MSGPALGPTQPPIQWVPVVKRQECEADHSPPSSAEVKNGGALPPLPHKSHRDNVTFTFYVYIHKYVLRFELVSPEFSHLI
jgi:hypothetical protein